MRIATFVCVSAAFVSVLALNGTVDAKVAPVRGAVCVQSGAKAREAVSGRGLVCVRTKTGVLRWRLQPKKTGTTTPTTVAPKAYRIGDVGPAGGLIFITPSTVGNSTGLYFEVAPFESEAMRYWATPYFSYVGNVVLISGANGLKIGDGAANTAAIVRQIGNVAESSAAVYASEYSVNGFSDWFLPSLNELTEMSKNYDSLGGFYEGGETIPSGFYEGTYWSSSEHSSAIQDYFGNTDYGGMALDCSMRGGGCYISPKGILAWARPVRAFPPTATVVPTTTTTTTVAPGAYRIGDVGPAGGTVFITPATPGNTTGLYFELAPLASEVRRTWATGRNWSVSVLGAKGLKIGDGAANTAAIVSQVGNVAASSAAVYASQYSVNGFSDWFLPSLNELNEAFKNRNRMDGLLTGVYWSSSELNEFLAWTQDFTLRYQEFVRKDAGGQSYGDEDDSIYVRPVRAFP